MHVHAHYNPIMRTTIELPDYLRAKLLDLAARRGEKGFSGLVSEAVAAYLTDLEGRHAKVARATAVLGTLSEDEAEEMRRSVAALRDRWR
jgi:metal-responsive CopG/Arc/MetJ family transcriptional regulator